VYDQREEQYHERRQEYLQAITPDAIEQSRRKMDAAYSAMEAAANWRRNFVMGAVGTWVFNLLESALIPPSCPISIPEEWESRFSAYFPDAISFQAETNAIQITWQRQF
jgi:hypothetical protein